MKILHCADLHMDSPMETHMTHEQAGQRNAEILKSFQRMTKYAEDENIRLILIAGDLFDGKRVTRRTVEGILDAVRCTPQIDYLYVSGNHDNQSQAFADEDVPENFKRFTDKWKTFEYGDVAVSGIEITKTNAVDLYQELPIQKKRMNIVMLHGQTSTVCDIDQVNLNLLKGKNIQYLALGHIHEHLCKQLDRDGIYCYPGCLEGRGFDECGEKGFVVLDTGRRKLEPVFVPFASRKLQRVTVDITGAASNITVYQAMKKASQNIPKKDMVEFILTGAANPTACIAEKYLRDYAKDDFFFVGIKDKTKLMIEPKEYENDISLKGEFIRLVMKSDASEEEKIKIIRAGLEALTGEEITV